MAELNTNTSQRAKAIKYIELNLGGGMVDVELDREHYDMAIDRAIGKYRQRSSRAVEESFMILKLSPGESNYRLPDEVIEVKVIYRQSAGGIGSTATNFEPFEAGYLNMYMLNAARGQGLASFELYMGQRELLGRMFGANVTFTWSPNTKMMSMHRYVKSDESVVLHTYNYRPDESLLTDVYAGQWLKDYATAVAKMSLGQARSKFASLAGPQGGVQLNGNDLISQGQAEIEKLEEALTKYEDGGTPIGFIFG
jgi:hypothetical protein